MLTPLQSRVLRVVHGIPSAGSIALAGGGALIVRGLVDRMTRDLDLFATVADEVDVFLPALEEALRTDGLTVERRQIAHGFARLLVADGDEQTVVDLAADYRLQPAEPTDLGLILSEEELATDKVLAVFG